ncbi:MAG: STAS domain-containing protein [Synechococcales bacterium]|nr:STAS domain-containing protein [Synechococcales bacterium]
MQSVLNRPQSYVIRPQGSVDTSNAKELQEHLAHIMSSSSYDALVVDMSQINSMDSSGLMALVSTFRLARKLNKRFSVCSLPAPIRIMFEVSQLDRAIEVIDYPSGFEMPLAA